MFPDYVSQADHIRPFASSLHPCSPYKSAVLHAFMFGAWNALYPFPLITDFFDSMAAGTGVACGVGVDWMFSGSALCFFSRRQW